MTQYLVPTHGTGPSTLPGETYHGFTIVPISDTACWAYTYAWNPERPLSNEERTKLSNGWALVCETDENYVPVRNVHNDFLIDRDEQKHRTYTGVTGLAEQDSMIQHSQGPIVDRTREILTDTDVAVTRFRSKLLKAAQDLASGKEPEAPYQPQNYRARPGSWLADGNMDVNAVMMERFGDPLGRVSGETAAAAE